MSKVYKLQDATKQQLAGGKAASLGALLRAGFTVPDGFVVTGAADALQSSILAAFDALNVRYVAVRSSALNEDGNQAAWAGQLETFLNVTRDTLLERIQECAKSAESDRAVAYAATKGASAGSVAVLVQAMVNSEVSGVAFSVHPVTGSRDHMVIEAGLGLGEAIVAGDITPDNYVIETATGNVIESHIAQQTKRLVRGGDAGNEWQTMDPPAADPKLSPQQLSEIVDNLRKLVEFYGFPVDVEWAYEAGKLYILQSRPVTTLS